MPNERHDEQGSDGHGLGPGAAELARMAQEEHSVQPPANINHLSFNPNALGLNEEVLQRRADSIQRDGLTPLQLLEIYNGDMVPDDPVLSEFVRHTYNVLKLEIQRRTGRFDRKDLTSFNYGVALSYDLTTGATEGEPPIMDVGNMKMASQYRDRPAPGHELRDALTGMFATQTSLSRAFDLALQGNAGRN